MYAWRCSRLCVCVNALFDLLCDFHLCIHSLGINILFNRSHSNFFCSSASFGIVRNIIKSTRPSGEEKKKKRKQNEYGQQRWNHGAGGGRESELMRNTTKYVFILLRCCFCYVSHSPVRVSLEEGIFRVLVIRYVHFANFANYANCYSLSWF